MRYLVSTLLVFFVLSSALAVPARAEDGGCVPISGPIGFRGSDIYFDSSRIMGGTTPRSSASFGQMIVGIESSAGPYQRFSVLGAVTLDVTKTREGSAEIANIVGTVFIDQQAQADIAVKFGDGACVSAVAIDFGHYSTYLYGGEVYLYLNGTKQGYKLVF